MKSSIISAVILAVVLGSAVGKRKFNEIIPICSQSDPKFEECVVSSGRKLLPILSKGLREYGVVPIDPLQVPFMELNQADGPVGLKLNVSDTTHYGLGSLEIERVKADLPKHHLDLEGTIPSYSLVGTYDAGGRILLLPIVGHGPCNLTAVNVKAKLMIDLKSKIEKNVKYCSIGKLQVKLKIPKGYFHLDGLFGGNKELGDTMNRFLNENSGDVFKELGSTLERVWSQLFENLLGRIFNNIPCDQILLP